MTRQLIEFGNAQRALPGESDIGDRCVVKLLDGRALLAVIDGLGHGRGAAQAAEAAVETIETFGHEPVDVLMRHCHERLVSTRGAAITLVLVDGRQGALIWVGAGNVAAVRVRRERSGTAQCYELFTRSGVAGGSLPSMGTSMTSLARGDLIVLATDGLRPEFVDAIDGRESPQSLAERLLADYHTSLDDALVVVARVQGEIA